MKRQGGTEQGEPTAGHYNNYLGGEAEFSSLPLLTEQSKAMSRMSNLLFSFQNPGIFSCRNSPILNNQDLYNYKLALIINIGVVWDRACTHGHIYTTTTTTN